MTRFLFILVFVALISCGSQKDTKAIKIKPEIPVEVLLENKIIPHRKDYKAEYYYRLPYLYYNGRSDFKYKKGDYLSMTHPIHREVNMSVRFLRDAGKHKNVILTNVWVEGFNQKALDTLSVEVFSSKHGLLDRTTRKKNSARQTKFKELFFIKEIQLNERHEIVKKLYDDVVTIIVDGYKYEFLNPELELDNDK